MELSINYFRDLLSKNVNNLENLCKEWNDIQTDSSVPEGVCDEIRTTIGLTNLLLKEKLKQFKGLIDDSEFKRGEKEISCLDLQGFWDMVYQEVEKIFKKFDKLEKSKANSWTFVEEPIVKAETKKKNLPAIAKTAVITKKHASAARQRLAEAKLKMKAQMAQQKPTEAHSGDKNSIVLITDEPPLKKEAKEKQNSDVAEVKSSSISNITNIPIAQQKDQNSKIGSSKKTPSSKAKSRSKAPPGVLEKENILSPQSSEFEKKPASTRRAKPKEFIPLQCVTRSAKKAMLAKQTELQKK